ncbi:MAG TPA: hypothetical protein VM261_28700 [Kofleriaceae bacterium]|nr:hypothetical protein [Kofleriaceae bacterium]
MRAVIRIVAVTAAVFAALAACNGKKPAPRSPLVDSAPVSEGDTSGRLVRELELEVLASYDREKLDSLAATAAVDARVGLSGFGVGPDDVMVNSALDDHWPVTEVAGARIQIVSRRLELFLSNDQTVGWAYDDISLRLPVCGRVASIPLRLAQVYVRDSERWTLVSEHAAYSQSMGRWLDTARGPDGARLTSAVEEQSESKQAQEVLAQLVAGEGDTSALWASDMGVLAVWPDPLHVLRGGAARSGPTLARTLGDAGDVTVAIDGLRLALGPGRNVAIANATLLAHVKRLRAGTDDPVDVRLRGTFVVERVGEAWKVRFAMVSTPITTGALVGRSVGVVARLESRTRVQTTCPASPGR